MQKHQAIGSGVAVAAVAGLCLAAAIVPAPAQDQQIGPPPGGNDALQQSGEGDFEILTRGPMHEAFAGPYLTDPQPGIIVDQQPPEPVAELPPEQMPAEGDAVWIPGYWGWEPDTQEFNWISGLWRNVPRDRRWIPGYWTEVPEGFQWVSGFWARRDAEQITYLPEPPASLERGPNIAPPDGDYFWIPGCWIWQNVTYEWRPGYWAPAVADWIWIPDQYVWSPYGCVFVPGFWDFDLVERGVLFAPVHFHRPIYSRPDYRYVPTVVVNTAPLLMHLFVGPAYHHYFYGDYYAFEPRGRFGFHPWYAYQRQANFYDPLLTYYQWTYARRNVDLVERLVSWNRYFISNEAHRPPHTYSEQRRFLARVQDTDLAIPTTAVAYTATIDEFAQSSPRARFQPVEETRRERIAQRAQAIQQFQQERNDFEAGGVAETGRAAGQTEPGARRERRAPGQQQQRERTLAVPESIAVAPEDSRIETPADRDAIPGQEPGEEPGQQPGTEPGQAEPQQGETEQGRARMRRQPPAPPRPSEDARDRARAAQPGEPGRPEAQAPTGRPDAPGRPDQTPAGRDDRDAPRRPGVTTPAEPDVRAEPEGERVPSTDQPDETRVPGRDDGPRFPRFGIGRSRPDLPGRTPGTDGAAPGRPSVDSVPTDRPNVRRGVDYFDRLPPGDTGRGVGPDRGNAAPNLPGTPERQPRIDLPGTPNRETQRPDAPRAEPPPARRPPGNVQPSAPRKTPDSRPPARRPEAGRPDLPSASPPAVGNPERRPGGSGKGNPGAGGGGPKGDAGKGGGSAGSDKKAEKDKGGKGKGKGPKR